MNIKNILTIAKKEFLSYVNSGTGYVLIVPVLLITFFLFFRQAFITNQASLRPFFDLFPFVLLFLAPAIAMRTFSQEQQNKTLELLFAHPISELEIVLGKFSGALAFYGLFLITTLSLPITTLIFAKPDLGVIISQYLGVLFVGGAFLAIGIACSVIVASQVASFLLAVAVSFGFILIGFDMVILALPSFLGAFVAQLAILPHMNNITRGALDFRDLLYFITIIGMFLTIAIIKLSERKIAETPSEKQKLYTALGLIIGIGIVVNIIMYTYPIRLDLTFNRLFTLSKGTSQTISQLPDILNITFYTSSNLPGTIESTVRGVKDMLRDYERLSKGKIKIIEKHPDQDPQAKSEANQNGIQEVQFNTLSNNAFAVQTGFVGMSLQYLDKKETIPFIQNTSDLEFQMTKLIRKMTMKQQPKLGLFTQQTSQYSAQQSSISVLRKELQDQYDLVDLNLSSNEASISARALLVYGITSNIGATASAKLQKFVEDGGNLILLLDNHSVNPQSGTAPSIKIGTEEMLLNNFGITVNQDLVYDLRLNETIALQSGNMQYYLPYPFWLKALPGKNKLLSIDNIGSVTLSWPNSFSVQAKDGVIVESLLMTSRNGGAQTGTFQIDPSKFKETDFSNAGSEMVVGLVAKSDRNRLVVIGDSDFLTDQFVQNASQNLAFASSIIDYVAADEALASISRKVGDNPVFIFSSANQSQIIQYLNLFLPAILVGAYGGWWLWRRKKRYNRNLKYEK